jgi:membrane associated rhomboid family serine protease
MFPISDSVRVQRFPLVNIAIVVFTSYIFYKELSAPNPDLFIQTFALVPSAISTFNPATWMPFITAIFLHGGFLHILSNMWFLWIFGDNVEEFFGPIRYLSLYFLAGIVGNIVQYAIMPSSSIPLLGASGAIAGVLGAYYVLYPFSKIKTLIFIFIFVTIIDIPAVIMLGYWFVLQLLSSSASIANIGQAGGVAFFAHVGGFITGALFARYFRARKGFYRVS